MLILIPWFAISYAVAPTGAIDTGPVQIIPSSQAYGPDGPWQTVNVSLGDPPQSVQLFPGGIFESVILSNGICSNSSLPKPCGSGGLYDDSKSDTIDDTSIGFNSNQNVTSIDDGQTQTIGISMPIMDQLQIPRVGFSNWVVPNLSISLVNEIYTTLPDGTSYPVQVGNLALGSAINQSFTTGFGPSINASLIPGWFYDQGVTGNTYGLHIGSAAMGIPLSLWLGGYDRSRVLGPVSSQPCFQNRLRIDLLDLGIGVDNGASPFNFSSRHNILDQGNSSMGDSTSVTIDSLCRYFWCILTHFSFLYWILET